HERGHQVVGVDVDPTLIEAAEQDHPGPTWLVGDLAELDLPSRGEPEPFDAAVMAGNVLWFVAPGSETDVLASVARHVKPDGVFVVGFGLGRTITVDEFEQHVAAAGLYEEHRFATWDVKAWSSQADYVVSVLRHGAGS